MDRRRFIIGSTAATLAGGYGLPAQAATSTWPRRPITIVVPFDAGGSADRLARGLAQYMPRYLGQPMIVVDHAGASGLIGTNWLLQQPADGYTVMFTPATPFLPVNILVDHAHFHLQDFTFVNAQWTDFILLLTPKSKPWRTAQDLINAIRANPGKLSTAVEFGSTGHISTLAFLEALGLGPKAVRIVTFDGAGALRTALAGAQVDFNVGQGEGADIIKNFVRPLAVFTNHPVPGYNVPMINDVLRGYHTSMQVIDGSMRTFVLPAGFKAQHPADYAKFVGAYQATLKIPEFRSWLKKNQMGDKWVGEEQTTQIVQHAFAGLSKYQAMLRT